MTDIQKQCLLLYLGYYDGSIDGIWGAKSAAATKRFQQENGLVADGNFGDATQEKILEVISSGEPATWWDEITHFTQSEFACKCKTYCDGYPAQMQQQLVTVAERVRNHFGVPVIVSSGLRCSRHNSNVGGVSNSRHLSGKAMDFCVRGKSSGEVLAYVQAQPEIRYAYAIDSSFVHMDIA